MKNKRKGFTLIELLAVIVILAIIALIATPLVLKYIEKARQGAAETSILSYVEAIETEVAASQLKNKVYPDKENYNFDEIKVSLKGTTPSSGSYSLKKGMVESGTFCINGYEVNYTTDGAKVTGSCDGKEQTCKEGMLCSKVKLGDYISMTPTSTSYSIPSVLTGTTGYYSNQTINPSELNLWRVIDIRDDGTIEMVSEYTSSTNVYFEGQTGFLNFVGTLNTIASQYENSKYTVGSRHMGYHGQTEYLTDTSKFTNPAPWTENTNGNVNEKVGGGDILYQYDTEETTGLVYKAIGSLKTTKPSGAEASYWLSGRFYIYNSPTDYHWWGRGVNSSGYVNQGFLYYYLNDWGYYTEGFPVRPIVTLKSDISNFSGSGTSAEPWVLE